VTELNGWTLKSTTDIESSKVNAKEFSLTLNSYDLKTNSSAALSSLSGSIAQGVTKTFEYSAKIAPQSSAITKGTQIAKITIVLAWDE
jgi:hypothetical protein